MCRVDPALIGDSSLAFLFSGACLSYRGYIATLVLALEYGLSYIRLWQRACMGQ